MALDWERSGPLVRWTNAWIVSLYHLRPWLGKEHHLDVGYVYEVSRYRWHNLYRIYNCFNVHSHAHVRMRQSPLLHRILTSSGRDDTSVRTSTYNGTVDFQATASQGSA